MTRWKRFLRWFRGECAVEGCDKPPADRTVDYCHTHCMERMRKIGKQIADEKFEYEVAVQVEALRRFHHEQKGIS